LETSVNARDSVETVGPERSVRFLARPDGDRRTPRHVSGKTSTRSELGEAAERLYDFSPFAFW